MEGGRLVEGGRVVEGSSVVLVVVVVRGENWWVTSTRSGDGMLLMGDEEGEEGVERGKEEL